MGVITAGVVENVNDDPPLNADRLEAAPDDITEKSDATAVVAPVDPDTTMVHTTDKATRDGFVLVQVICEAGVGLP